MTTETLWAEYRALQLRIANGQGRVHQLRARLQWVLHEIMRMGG